MKKLWIVSIILIWVSGAGAQIVLEPRDTGTSGLEYYYRYGLYKFTVAGSVWTLWDCTWDFNHFCDKPTIKAGKDSRSWTFSSMSPMYSPPHTSIGTYYFYKESTCWQGVIEFSLNSVYSGQSVPTGNMTPSNWTAKIDSIILNYRHDAGQDMAMEIYDLDDDKENGNVDIYDYDSYREQITTLSGETTFNDIDITDVLRRDLFGEGAGDLTSGFLFLESGGAWHINHELPRISINLHTPTPPPTLPPTVTPTFTPTPEPWSGVRLFLSGDSFTSGDAFKLRALCRGEPGKTAADLYVILDVFGYYWFYPSWQQHPDCKQIPLEDGRSSYHFIMDFTWPDGDFGHVDGLVFWSAITEPTTFNIIGDYDHVEFGYY